LQAVEIAKREGLSLNQFIVIALVEKITRMVMLKGSEPAPGPKHQDDTKCA